MTLGISSASAVRLTSFALLLSGAAAASHPLRQITIGNTGGEEPLVVVLTPSGSDCKGPLTARKAPHPLPITGPCAQDARLAVFHRDRAAVFLDARQLRAAAPHLTIALKPALRLPVHVWHESPRLKANAMDDIANTNWLLRRNRAGFVLNASYEEFPPAKTHSDGFDCVKPPPSKAFHPGRINIYYGSGASRTCPGHDRVFVKASDELGTLAHELGHALGIDAPDGDDTRIYDNEGHTGGFDAAPRNPAPFDGANAMWRRSLIFRDTFTLGQVFWMNFNSTGAFPSYRKENGMALGLDCKTVGQCAFFREDPVNSVTVSGSRAMLPNKECPQARIAVESTPEAIRTAIAARLIDRPRYCTQPEVRRILEQRFAEVCGKGGCGSASPEDFVARWGDRSGGIAAWVSEEGARIFAMRHPDGCDAACRARAEQTENVVIGYVTSDLITRIRDKRILWLDDPQTIRPEADVFRKLLVQVDPERDPNATYALIIANRKTAEAVLGSGAERSPVIVYEPGKPYAALLTDDVKAEAKKKGALGLTDCPLELYGLAVGQFLRD